jgi:hypothetical protein
MVLNGSPCTFSKWDWQNAYDGSVLKMAVYIYDIQLSEYRSVTTHTSVIKKNGSIFVAWSHIHSKLCIYRIIYLKPNAKTFHVTTSIRFKIGSPCRHTAHWYNSGTIQKLQFAFNTTTGLKNIDMSDNTGTFVSRNTPRYMLVCQVWFLYLGAQSQC